MQSSTINKEIKDVFYLIALQGLNYIAPLLVLPYLMKVLGAEKFGYIGFSLSVMQYLMLIVDFGFNLTATKRITLAKNNHEELNQIFTSTLYAKIGLLAISFVVLILLACIPRFAEYKQTMFVMFPMVIGNAFTFVWLFQGLGKIKIVSIVNVIAKLSILPLTFILVKSSDDYLIAALLQSLVIMVGTMISVGIIIRGKWISIVSFVKKNTFFELKESFPVFLSSAATSIYMASFVIVLGYFSTSAEVGQYSAVDRIMRALCYLVLTPVLQAFYPKITYLGKDNKPEAISLVYKLLIFVGICMFMIFIGMYFLSPFIIVFLGNDYQNANVLFKIMAFAPIFIGIGGIVAQLGILALGNSTDKKNYQHTYFIAGIVALITVFPTAFFWGANGVAISLLITEATVCILMFWFGRKILF